MFSVFIEKWVGIGYRLHWIGRISLGDIAILMVLSILIHECKHEVYSCLHRLIFLWLMALVINSGDLLMLGKHSAPELICLAQCLISFNNVLWCLVYKYYTSLIIFLHIFFLLSEMQLFLLISLLVLFFTGMSKYSEF